MSALTASTVARIGASLVKTVPVVGTVLGGVSMSGASTYAVGQVAISHFSATGGLKDVNLEWAKRAYGDALERGKKLASDLAEKKEPTRDAYEQLGIL